jgi:hypothetical protein
VMIRIAPVMRHVYVPQRVILAYQVMSAVPVNVTLLKEYANRFHIAEVVIKLQLRRGANYGSSLFLISSYSTQRIYFLMRLIN